MRMNSCITLTPDLKDQEAQTIEQTIEHTIQSLERSPGAKATKPFFLCLHHSGIKQPEAIFLVICDPSLNEL